MADMVAAPRAADELDVALYLLPLAFGAYSSMAVQAGIFTVVYISSVQQGIHLAVGHYRFAQPGCLPHRRLHDGIFLHTASVVRKADHLIAHGRHIRQFPAAVLPHGDGTVRNDLHDRPLSYHFKLHPQMLRRIGRRIEVGHRADRRIAAPGRRTASRSDGLLV